jgi:peptidyl-prolyl cis-trans isomerase D
MSIIQTIRDKAWIIFVAIAVALIAFIVQDGFQGSGMFGQGDTSVGKINGKSVDLFEFEQKIKNYEDNYQAQGYNVNEQVRQQIRDEVWNSMIIDQVLNDRFKTLGFQVTDNEVYDILYGANPPAQLRQQFIDSLGNYDAQAAYTAIRSLQPGSPQHKSIYGEFIPALREARIKEKYVAAIANSAYVPKWLVEKNNSNNAQVADIEYVAVPYTSIADSTIKVTDADIKAYLEKNKDLYKQEATRSIEYVVFDASPNAQDTASLVQAFEQRKEAFKNAPDVNQYVSLENSESQYYDGIISRKEIKIVNFDDIASTEVGEVYGPYIDGGHVSLARMVEKKVIPDTVKVRHILIATNQRDQAGNMYPVRADNDAKELADSIADAIKKGSSFTALCEQFSDDQSSIANGGEYDKIVTGSMMPEFNDFIFKNATGAKGVVKTDFGYHYVEILSQKGNGTGYKVAYFTQSISPSDRTINAAQIAASTFAAGIKNYDQFVEKAKSQNLNRFTATDIKNLDANIYGIGNSRELVKWIYNDASVGEVSNTSFNVGNKYIVPVVTGDYKEGLMDVKKARALVEFKVRNEKKAEKIVNDAKNHADLQSIAEATGQLVLVADSVSFSNPYVSNVGQEQKFIGSAFNPANKEKVSAPIVGEQGVYFVKVKDIKAVTTIPTPVEEAQKSMIAQQKSMIGYRLFDIIQKSADVKDSRSKFY